MKKFFAYLILLMFLSNAASYGFPRIKVNNSKAINVALKKLKVLKKDNDLFKKNIKGIREDLTDTCQFAKLAYWTSCISVCLLLRTAVWGR